MNLSSVFFLLKENPSFKFSHAPDTLKAQFSLFFNKKKEKRAEKIKAAASYIVSFVTKRVAYSYKEQGGPKQRRKKNYFYFICADSYCAIVASK